MPEHPLTKPPWVEQCPQCGDWTLTGTTLTGDRVTLGLVGFIPATYAAWTVAGGRRVWRVLHGGVCRVRPGDGTPMAEWRAEHPCPRPEPQEAASRAFTPPCDSNPEQWCERTAADRSAGVRNCDACDRPPFEHSPEQIIVCALGAQVIEREVNGRLVYRKYPS